MRFLWFCCLLLLASCASPFAPRTVCHTAIQGHYAGRVIHWTDDAQTTIARIDTLRIDPKLWADTLQKCSVE